MLNRILFGLGLVLAVGGPTAAILQKEHLLRSGRVVLLELAPRDPRSLMQGDYMALRYRLSSASPLWGSREGFRGGWVVLRDDPRGVGEFLRVHGGEPLGPGEYLLHLRGRNARIGAESYFFQEGKAQDFAAARFGELRVSPQGEALLAGLRDQNLQPLGSNR